MYRYYMPKKITSDTEGINKLINIYNKSKDINDLDILYDFSSTNWISGEMLSLFGAITYNLIKKFSKRIYVDEFSNNIKELFRGNNFSSIIPNIKDGNMNNNSIKFNFFKEQLEMKNNDCFAEYLISELSPKIELSAEEIQYIISNLSEIFINARTHGATTDIFCCGQKYPKLNKLRLMIVDLGVGIPYNVRKKVNLKSDAQCISWSIESGNTTKDISKEAGGLGLSLVKDFIKEHNGNLIIISDYGQYIFENDKINNNTNKFDGTIVYIDFDYTAIKYIDNMLKIIKKDNFNWNF